MTDAKHEYLAPSEFVKDVGYVARCSCGWASEGTPTPRIAQDEFLDHAAEKTYWNGEPCAAERCEVIVGWSSTPTWWCADLEGTKRQAVRVHYAGNVFYLDNEDGSGWAKVTEGHGSPNVASRSLPNSSTRVER